MMLLLPDILFGLRRLQLHDPKEAARAGRHMRGSFLTKGGLGPEVWSPGGLALAAHFALEQCVCRYISSVLGCVCC